MLDICLRLFRGIPETVPAMFALFSLQGLTEMWCNNDRRETAVINNN